MVFEQPIIDNEVGRFVVQLPDDATICRAPSYVAVAFEASQGGVHATLPGQPDRRLRYHSGCEVVASLCTDRALRVVDESLVINGRPLAPERYLGLWRRALSLAASAQQLAERHRVRLVAVLDAPLAPLLGRRSGWSGSPFGTFDAFAERHARQMVVDSGGRFTLRLDLRQPDAARDAYFGEEFCRAALTEAHGPWHASLALDGDAHVVARAARRSSDLWGA